MIARPILFSSPMIRALLDGTKTQTRRAIKAPTARGGFVLSFNHGTPEFNFGPDDRKPNGDLRWHRCPYGKPGDLLWVRETWASVCKMDGNDYFVTDEAGEYVEETWYRADGRNYRYIDSETDEVLDAPPWKSSIHMPRALSRLTLRITDVRVQRLHQISEDDAKAEGVDKPANEPAVSASLMKAFGGSIQFEPYGSAYAQLWEQINGPGSWDANPWVWALTFDVIKQNIGTIEP